MQVKAIPLAVVLLCFLEAVHTNPIPTRTAADSSPLASPKQGIDRDIRNVTVAGSARADNPERDTGSAKTSTNAESAKSRNSEATHGKPNEEGSYDGLTAWSTFATAMFAALTFLVAIAQAIFFWQQLRMMKTTLRDTNIASNAAAAQLHLMNRPRLVARHIHIWEKGKGLPLDPENAIPRLQPGDHIEGTAFVINEGGNPATITKSDCITAWIDGELTMNNPLWRSDDRRKNNELRGFAWSRGSPTFDVRFPLLLESMDSRGLRWEFETIVPPGGTASLYVLGTVDHIDSLGHRRSLLFASRYDRSTNRFVEETASNYHREG